MRAARYLLNIRWSGWNSAFLFAMVAGLVVLPFSSTHGQTVLFEEDFEAYAEGSDLFGQDGWVYEPLEGVPGTDKTLVGTGSGLGSKVSNGMLSPGQDTYTFCANLFLTDIARTEIYTLTFDAYASSDPRSHNSAVKFHSTDWRNVCGWECVNNPESAPYIGWAFDARWIAGGDVSDVQYVQKDFPGHYDTPVTLVTVLDPADEEVYGFLIDDQNTYETDHFPIDLSRAATIDGIALVQDYGSPSGMEIDNINVTATPAPFPDISVSPTSHNFGGVEVGSASPAQTFIITNRWDADPVLDLLSLTGADTFDFIIENDQCSYETIAPSGTCNVDLLFQPASEGLKSANLLIASMDPAIPPLEVSLSGQGVPEDTDSDGVPDNDDNCSNHANSNQVDTDDDGVGDLCDDCPNDPNKTVPGICGCGVADTDSDGDGTADCIDDCPSDPNKTVPGICGCGVPDTDSDGDGTADCIDGCPSDPNKTAPGVCGCGVADTDSDVDGKPDCIDGCPADAQKIKPGICGCGVSDIDSDVDGVPDCIDTFPSDPNEWVDTDRDETGNNADTDDDNDGVLDEEEQGPDGTDINYSGNDDTEPDRLQNDVTSLHTHDGSYYVTLESSDPATLINCRAVGNPDPNGAPARRNFLYGFFAFQLTGFPTPPGCAEVTLFLPKNTGIRTYWKYGPTDGHPTDHWYEFMDNGETGAEILQEDTRTVIVLHLCDGDGGDDDIIVDGKIVDTGGPASIIPGGGSSGGGCFVGTAADRLGW